jgi:hypothetical protein
MGRSPEEFGVWIMSLGPILRVLASGGFIAIVPNLVGCATTSTSDVGQVREVASGTYKVHAGSGNSVLFGGHEAADAAVDQAGKYCHARGQKLVILPTKDKDITFQCGQKVMPGE